MEFPAIILREVWEKAQAIREKRTKEVFVDENQATRSKRDSKDIWVNKLRCSCGCAFRRNRWHTKLDGKISYGYQCYNQIRYGKAKKSRSLDLDSERYCDIKMICDWKLNFIAKILMEYL